MGQASEPARCSLSCPCPPQKDRALRRADRELSGALPVEHAMIGRLSGGPCCSASSIASSSLLSAGRLPQLGKELRKTQEVGTHAGWFAPSVWPKPRLREDSPCDASWRLI